MEGITAAIRRSIQWWPGGRGRVTVRRQGIATGGRDGTVGQMPLHHVRFDDQHLEYIVQHIPSAGTPMTEVSTGEQAQCFAVHLEEIKIKFGQIEFTHTEAQEDEHIVAAPETRIRWQRWWQLCLQFRQLAGWGRGATPDDIAPDAGIERIQ